MATIQEIEQALDGAVQAGELDDARALQAALDQAKEELGEAGLVDYGRQALQGLTLGFGDELVGAGRGAYEAFTEDKPLMQSMGAGIDAERAALARGRERMGEGAAIAAEIAGGLPLGLASAGRAALKTGVSNIGKLWNAAKIGAGTGAVAGAGMSEGGLVDRAGGAAMGGITGGLLSPAIVGAGALAKGGANYIGRVFPGGSERQSKTLMRSLITPEQAARMQSDVRGLPAGQGVLADVAPEDAFRVVGESLRKVGGGEASKMLRERHRGQIDRIIPRVDEMISGKTLKQAVGDLNSKRRAAAKLQYGKLYKAPVELTDEMKRLFKTDTGEEGWKLAQRLAKDEGIDLPPLYKEDGKTLTMVDPDMEWLDLWKRGMDAVVEARYKESGTLGASAKGVRDALRDHLDDIVPEYKNVRSTYAGYSAAMDAAEQGKNFMRSAMSETGKDIMEVGDIPKMGDHELSAFRSGMASVIREQLKTKPFGANIATFFDTPAKHEKLNAVLGPANAKRFLAGMDAEMKMARTYGELQGSQTAQRLSAGEAMGDVRGLAADAMGMKAGSPISGLNMVARAVEAINAPPTAVAREVADMMATQSPRRQADVLGLLMQPEPVIKGVSPFARGLLGYGGGYTAGSLQGN